jgi:hypothetical protein
MPQASSRPFYAAWPQATRCTGASRYPQKYMIVNLLIEIVLVLRLGQSRSMSTSRSPAPRKTPASTPTILKLWASGSPPTSQRPPRWTLVRPTRPSKRWKLFSTSWIENRQRRPNGISSKAGDTSTIVWTIALQRLLWTMRLSRTGPLSSLPMWRSGACGVNLLRVCTNYEICCRIFDAGTAGCLPCSIWQRDRPRTSRLTDQRVRKRVLEDQS